MRIPWFWTSQSVVITRSLQNIVVLFLRASLIHINYVVIINQSMFFKRHQKSLKSFTKIWISERVNLYATTQFSVACFCFINGEFQEKIIQSFLTAKVINLRKCVIIW